MGGDDSGSVVVIFLLQIFVQMDKHVLGVSRKRTKKREVGTYMRNLKSDYPLRNVNPPRRTPTPCIQSTPLVLLGVYLLLCQSTYRK